MLSRDFIGLQIFFCRLNIHGMGCLKKLTFPPKNLEKIRVLKLRMRQFLFFFQSSNKLYLYSFVVFLLSAVSKQARIKCLSFAQ